MLTKFNLYIEARMFGIEWGRREDTPDTYDIEKEDAPYGFWILPDGSIHKTGYQDHHGVARRIYKELYGKDISTETYAPYFKLGWMRLVRGENWDGKTNNGKYEYDYMKKTKDQDSALSEIKAQYNGKGFIGYKVEDDDYI
jgi:hypothetical protein